MPDVTAANEHAKADGQDQRRRIATVRANGRGAPSSISSRDGFPPDNTTDAPF
jgi:hypothetical protein